MENKICSFFGHREICITKELRSKLLIEIEKLIKKGFNIFYFGGFGDFDNLCWEVTTELKKQYKYIKRILCVIDLKSITQGKLPKWIKKENYEEIIYLNLEFDWWYKRIYYRNCEMIKCSDFIIFYIEKTENSGAYKAMQYAKIRKKAYINIYCK